LNRRGIWVLTESPNIRWWGDYHHRWLQDILGADQAEVVQMKILYITEIYPDPKRGIGVWGGGERQFYEISRRVAAKGHDVTILTCRFQSIVAKLQPKSERID